MSVVSLPPVVVRLKRKNNQVVQGCDVYIGRRCARGGWDLPDSKWANPFTVQQCNGSNALAVQKYREHILARPDLMQAIVPELGGKTLGCWCHPEPCHGQVLVELFLQQQRQQQERQI